MTDTDRMVVWLRAAMDAAERDAQELEKWTLGGPFAATMVDPIVGPFGGQSRMRNFAAGAAVARLADPAAVLRRITADRQILDLHSDSDDRCAVCYSVRLEGADDDLWATEEPMTYPCATVRLLAEGWGWTEETP